MLALKSAFFTMAVVVGVALLFAIFINPYIGLILYVILLFLRPQDFIPALSPLRIMLYLAMVVLLFFLVRKVFNRERIEVFSTRQNILMFVLLLIVPLSDLSNLRVVGAWESFNSFLTLMFPFFLIVSITGRKYKILYWSLTFTCLFLAVNGIIQHYNGVDLFGLPPMNDRIKWVGIFGDPNDFALLHVFSISIVLFHLFRRRENPLVRIGLLAMLAVFFMAIYLTNSRGGYLGVITVLVGFAFKNWGLRKGLIGGAVLMVVALILAPDRMAEISPYGQSASGRVYAWMGGFVILKSHPILGVGMNRFTEYYARSSHSAFIKCVTELGLVGFFVWMSLIYTSFRDLIRVEKMSGNSTLVLYSRITQISMIGFLASAFFLSQTYNPIIYILFAISAVLSLAMRKETGLKFPIFTRNEFISVLLLEGGAILIYKVFMIIY